ncbi:MAG: GIY-YIG nuclease family protein [Eubacterium sp.]|nr:GIY-YIG nuclease family protein [Eubacterium sp.]
MSFDKTIQLFIFDGNPNGRIMCELSNWNGRVYKVSRNEIAEFDKRADASHTGVYFLIGNDDDNNTTIYIGEAENIISRLRQHISDEYYWNVAIAVISKDNLLNKAHVKYLENEFYNLANDAARSVIINKSIPTRSSISEYDEAMLKEFVENTKLLVNTLGYKVFDLVVSNTEENNDKEMFFINAARGANGKGIIVSDGFAVLKGSSVASTVTKSCSQSICKKRQFLIDEGIINKGFEFVKDYVFSSPSMAAAVIMGRNANGLTEWKTDEGMPLKVFIEYK